MEENSGSGSGSQSGWSTYLGPSSFLSKSRNNQEEEGEEDEGFSMVSDASSGPALFHEVVQKDCGKRRRTEMNNPARQKDSLDDTASSPLSNVGDLKLSDCCRCPASTLFLNTEFPPQASFNISDDTARSACSDVEVSSEFSATYLKGWRKLWKPLSYSEDKAAFRSSYGGEG